MCAFFALFAAFCAAKAQETPAVASPLFVGGFPAPDVPETAPVDPSYFEGAVLIGDSMVEPFDLLGSIPGLKVLPVIGISARTAHEHRLFKLGDEKALLKDLLAAMNPPALYLWLGSNGVDTKPADLVIEDYDRLMDALIPVIPDTVIYLMALPPARPMATEHYKGYTNARVNAFNEGLREVARRHNVYFLDIHPLVLNEKGEMEAAYSASDGIHLKNAAYALLTDYMMTHTVPIPKK